MNPLSLLLAGRNALNDVLSLCEAERVVYTTCDGSEVFQFDAIPRLEQISISDPAENVSRQYRSREFEVIVDTEVFDELGQTTGQTFFQVVFEVQPGDKIALGGVDYILHDPLGGAVWNWTTTTESAMTLLSILDES